MTSKTKTPSRRLPIFNALRSNDQLKTKTVLSSFGPISEPIHDAMLKLPLWLQEELLVELSTAALFLEDHINRQKPKQAIMAPAATEPKTPTKVTKRVKVEAIATNTSAHDDIEPAEAIETFTPASFGEDTFPAWFKWYLHTQDVEILRTLTQEEADQQRTMLIGTVLEVTPGGKLRWSFNTNPSKTGFAFLTDEQLHLFKKGDVWLLKHNGQEGIDSGITGGRKLRAEEAQPLAYTLAATWRRYH